MSQSGRLNYLAITLDRLGVPFMLTGSLVSSLQGEPRATHDIDVVIDLPTNRIDAVLEAFPPPDFFLSREAMEEAIRTNGMFNVLDVREGDQFDFWILTDEPSIAAGLHAADGSMWMASTFQSARPKIRF